jgi:hypothetical protein
MKKASAGAAERKITAVQAENERRAAIQVLCKANKDRCPRRAAVDRRRTRWSTRPEWTARSCALASPRRFSRSWSAGVGENSTTGESGPVGTRDTQKFSLFKAIRALRYGGQRPKLLEEAAYELECSNAVGKKLGRDLTSSILIPGEVLQRPLGRGGGERAMATQPGAKGGYMVNVQNMGFIDILRNRSVAMTMGARDARRIAGQRDVSAPDRQGLGDLAGR